MWWLLFRFSLAKIPSFPISASDKGLTGKPDSHKDDSSTWQVFRGSLQTLSWTLICELFMRNFIFGRNINTVGEIHHKKYRPFEFSFGKNFSGPIFDSYNFLNKERLKCTGTYISGMSISLEPPPVHPHGRVPMQCTAGQKTPNTWRRPPEGIRRQKSSPPCYIEVHAFLMSRRQILYSY